MPLTEHMSAVKQGAGPSSHMHWQGSRAACASPTGLMLKLSQKLCKIIEFLFAGLYADYTDFHQQNS